MNNPKNCVGNVNYKLTSLIIFSLVFFDVLSVYLGIRLSIIPRLLLILTCVLGIISTRVKVHNLQFLCCLMTVFILQQCISYLLLPNISVTFVVENFGLILKVISFPLLLIWFKLLNKTQLNFLKTIIYFSMLFYCFSIVVSPLLGWNSLLTYGETGRFGFKGVIAAGNETAMVLLIACFWTGQYYLLKKNAASLTIFILMVLAALMLGTKAGLLIAVTALMGVFAVNFNKIRLSHKIVLAMLVIMLLIFLANWFWEVLFPMLEASFQYFTSKLINTSLHGYFSLLVSGRDTKLMEVMAHLEVTNYVHLLIGGWPISLYMVEMDYFDLILLFGIPIGSLLFYFYFYLVITSLTKSSLHLLFIALMAIITFLAGHVIFSMLHAPLLASYIVSSSSPEERLN